MILPISQIHSAMVGGVTDFQWRGITDLAAPKQKPINDFLHFVAEPGSMDSKPTAGVGCHSNPVNLPIIRNTEAQNG
ncbi:hypothetical protein XELAEV_18010666mg [Xenopus laevis]|uniref:Uncharacterized protein n=1 Tax=Xenopus laevis TaxID=8355 RepID=A0A974I1R3_XENLA|nr:hypothetical protein XELAEV_18010666mg [Xenopus laevis]